MGYHLILRKGENKIEHIYCEKYEELANYPIKENSIIYEGEDDQTPSLVKESEKFKWLSDLRYRGSIKAEKLFIKQALEKGYMIEVINQDQDSFSQYYQSSKDFLNIKRGDFLIRNVGNLEIEVKCKTVYWKKEKKQYFYFEKEHLEKHLEMQSYTKTPVVLAFYKREKETENPIKNELYMISMDCIQKIVVEELQSKPTRRDWGEAYSIPLARCKDGFEWIEDYKKKINRIDC